MNDDIIVDCLPSVKQIADYYGRNNKHNIDVSEMTSIANMALMNATLTFKVNKGASFKTYAMIKVKYAIFEKLKICERRFVSDKNIQPLWPYKLDKFDDFCHDYEVHDTIETGMKALKPRERTVVEMYYYDGASQVEIASALNTCDSVISRTLTQSRKKMRERIDVS